MKLVLKLTVYLYKDSCLVIAKFSAFTHNIELKCFTTLLTFNMSSRFKMYRVRDIHV